MLPVVVIRLRYFPTCLMPPSIPHVYLPFPEALQGWLSRQLNVLTLGYPAEHSWASRTSPPLSKGPRFKSLPEYQLYMVLLRPLRT
jgi:hypothetical protein